MKINLNKVSLRKIDIEKRKLEEIYKFSIRKILRTIAVDSENIYKAMGRIPYKEMALSYKEEFEKEIKDILRKTVKKFAFNLREDIKKKYYLNSNIEFKKDITIKDENIVSKLEKINNEFFIVSQNFFFNTSKSKSEIITSTNEDDLERSVVKALKQFEAEDLKKRNKLAKLEGQLIFETQANNNIEKEIAKIKNQIKLSNENKNKIVGKNIKANLLGKINSRSDVITSDLVGLGESWGRYTEAKIINDAKIIAEDGGEIKPKKTWIAILDSKTRESHAVADGQTIEIDEDFIVGGEQLEYPRDTKGSAENIINCRCLVEYGV